MDDFSIMGKYGTKQEATDKFSLRGRVFHKIRDDILSGKYKDNEELKEVAIDYIDGYMKYNSSRLVNKSIDLVVDNEQGNITCDSGVINFDPDAEVVFGSMIETLADIKYGTSDMSFQKRETDAETSFGRHKKTEIVDLGCYECSITINDLMKESA